MLGGPLRPRCVVGHGLCRGSRDRGLYDYALFARSTGCGPRPGPMRGPTSNSKRAAQEQQERHRAIACQRRIAIERARAGLQEFGRLHHRALPIIRSPCSRRLNNHRCSWIMQRLPLSGCRSGRSAGAIGPPFRQARGNSSPAPARVFKRPTTDPKAVQRLPKTRIDDPKVREERSNVESNYFRRTG